MSYLIGDHSFEILSLRTIPIRDISYHSSCVHHHRFIGLKLWVNLMEPKAKPEGYMFGDICVYVTMFLHIGRVVWSNQLWLDFSKHFGFWSGQLHSVWCPAFICLFCMYSCLVCKMEYLLYDGVFGQISLLRNFSLFFI